MQNQFYIIDEKDIITAAGDDWNTFANDNNSDCTRSDVVGKSIWNFIANEDVQHSYKSIFAAVRKQNTATTLNFRCDSEKVLRFMNMEIAAAEASSLNIKTSMVREIPRRVVLSREIIYLGMAEGTPMCSSCNKIYVPKVEEWVEIDDALERKLITDQLKVSFELCSSCKEYLKDVSKI